MTLTKLKKISVAVASVALLSAASIVPAFADDTMTMDMESNNGNQAASNTQGEAQWFTDTIRPLNNSGVYGNARLKLQGDQLTVWMTAYGLEPGKEHLQHIHGKVDGSNSECPAPTANTDNDGTISLGEGLPFYGPILQSLTPFQTPSVNGREVYQNTFTVNTSDPTKNVLPLANREIVLHGMTVAANQDLDNPTAGYDVPLPVACGHIVPMIGNGYKHSDSDRNIRGNRAYSHNRASYNTDGDLILNLGDAMSSISIFNRGNSNMFQQ